MVASHFRVKFGTVKAPTGFRTVPKLVPGKETQQSRVARQVVYLGGLL